MAQHIHLKGLSQAKRLHLLKERQVHCKSSINPRKVMLDNNNNNLCLNVKVMFMCNANGDFSDLVTIISNPALDCDQWHVEKVAGLSNKPGPNSGYI